MKLFFAPNTFTEAQVSQALECIKVLEDTCGHECALSAENTKKLFPKLKKPRFKPEDSDMVVSLGGDGAVLRAAQTAVKYNKPLLGINNGRLGYLCAFNSSKLDRFNEILPTLKHSERALLKLKYRDGECLALNDVVIGKQHFGETVDLDIYVTDSAPLHIRGDGIIIATPTGSTAYNLAAGGPLLDVKLPAVLLTPVCAHAPHTNPIVISNEAEIKVLVHHGSANIYADGSTLGSLEEALYVNTAAEKLVLCARNA